MALSNVHTSDMPCHTIIGVLALTPTQIIQNSINSSMIRGASILQISWKSNRNFFSCSANKLQSKQCQTLPVLVTAVVVMSTG